MTTMLWVLGLFACGEPAEEAKPEKPIPEACKAVSLEHMAGDWLLARGTTADPATRLRVMGDAATGYTAWYTGGAFTKVSMTGTVKADDGKVVFVEEPTPEKARRVAADAGSLAVLHVTPDVPHCVLQVQIRSKNGAGKEEIVEKTEFGAFPKASGITLAWQPATEPAFLGESAKDKKKADAELAELGEPRPDAPFGKVPVGAFSKAEADGDPSCTFDMDLWFDDQPAQQKVPAGEVKDGFRSWFHEWDAPYSGNHFFEIHRYATCGGGERKLLGIAAVSAVLN